MMRPLDRSYGDSAHVTRSPASTRIRNLRILPAIVASTEWPLVSTTRNVELRSSSSTFPSISIAASFVMSVLRLLDAFAGAPLDVGPVAAGADFHGAARTIGLELHATAAFGTTHRAVGHQGEPLGGAVHR